MNTVQIACSGSGFLGGILAGGICALKDQNATINGVAGTSGGSIVATATALGMTTEELYSLSVADMSGLLTWNVGAWFSGAWCNGKALEKWLDQKFAGATFRDVKIPLQIIATDLHAGSAFVFSQATTPDVKLSLACRASSAVPLVYSRVNFDGRILIDGGVTNNIPVDRLPVVAGETRVGLDVDEPATYSTDPIWAYMGSLVHLLLASNENNIMHLEASTGAVIIKTPTGGAGFLDCNLPLKTKQQLFKDGYRSVWERATQPLTKAGPAAAGLSRP